MKFRERDVVYEVYIGDDGAIIKVKDKSKYWLKWVINFKDKYLVEYFGKDILIGVKRFFYGKKFEVGSKELEELYYDLYAVKVANDRERIKNIVRNLNRIFSESS